MLSRLHIENFALIDELDIEFGDGLNVLTGATGAGKSIIVGALDLILGGRGSEEIIRTGQSTCVVEAEFQFKDRRLEQHLREALDIERGDGSLTIRREYKRKGGGRAFIEDSQVAISGLREISERLADILGQHSHQALLDPATHCGYLDRYAGLDDDVAEHRAVFGKAVQLRDEIRTSDRLAREISDRIDLLTFQTIEIDRSSLRIGEEESLREEKKLLENSQKVCETAAWVIGTLLEDEGSAVERIGQAQKGLAAISSAGEAIKKFINLLAAASDTLSDAVFELKKLVERIDDDPSRLREINERLDEIYGLRKKYGASIADILDYAEKSRAELAALRARQVDSQTLKERFEKSLAELNTLAREISAERHRARRGLEKLVVENLVLMGIPRAQFIIEIGQIEDANGLYEKDGVRLAGDAIGFDVVEFQFCANPGEGLKPLAKIASGGEISRVMLALKNAFLKKKESVCEVFDEIDVGISGEVAAKVARQLRELSAKHQVICITHLAQIASVGDHHYKVFKATSGGRSVTRVLPLDGQERVKEIAGLISGEKITPKALAGAEELLRAADRGKSG
jgi:DNA repair protein RecN (Recombination protein N)